MHTPITYYGGKQMLVDTILPMIPTHKIYCEPYFGGGAIFFAKGKSYLEAINDINDRAERAEAEYEECRLQGMTVNQAQESAMHVLLHGVASD